MKITTQRILSGSDVQDMCERYNYYTGGNCQDYERLRKRVNNLNNVSNKDIYNIAVDIIEHTPELDMKGNITAIMFLVDELTHTFYTITD
ncbi:MAG: hypothetical protein RR338_03025 [Clostridia bacterium]